MKQLDGKSLDIVSENVAKLKELFPEVFSEGKIDFDKLKEELGQFSEQEGERYNFTWNGKQEAKHIAQTPSTGTLRPCKEESKNWDTTQNLYIEGDNLEVLKLLQKSYHKQVKMIYIDPPYNTGKDFVYKDNFRDNIKNYMEITGQVDSEGNRLSTNSDTNGRYHSDWLNMMYPRLKLARNLLKDDGVIFISIDDNEVANLRKVCDEIFGEDNFVSEISVASNSSKNNAKLFSISHEYMLCYAKSKICINEEWQVKKNNVDEYYSRAMQLVKRGLTEEEIHNELLELVKYPRFYDLDHYTFADESGIYQTDNPGGVSNGNMLTEIFHPVTSQKCSKPNGGWRYKDEEIQRMLNENLFSFGEDETVIPRPKRYLKDYMYQVPKSTMFFDSQSSTKWLKSNKIPFDFAKSIDLIKHILSIFPNDVVLDFFSCSATTAHAVMKLNSEDGGNRKFICVQLPEENDEKSEAYKAGYKNICEIGKARIRKAGEKVKSESVNEELDIGFKVLKLDSSNIKTWDSDFENLEANLLDAVDNVKDDRISQDLLYEILLKYGLDLTLPIEETSIIGKTVYNIGYGALIVCLDDEITIEVVEAIAELIKSQVVYDEEKKKRHARVVFKDKSFADTNVKTNAIQVLKQFDIDDVVSI